jgi:anaerobic selenocysteine-containing dehydrogenase
MPGKCQDEVAHDSQMIRNSDGELVRASWDEAMDLIVRKSKDTIEKLSNHGMAFYTRRATQYALGTHWLIVLFQRTALPRGVLYPGWFTFYTRCVAETDALV